MRDQRSRMVATIVIWSTFGFIAFAFFALLFLTANANSTVDIGGAGVITILIFAIGSVIATEHIWKGGGEAEAETDGEQGSRKAKRRSRERIERLMEALDDDEIIELETLLMAQDDEALHGEANREF